MSRCTNRLKVIHFADDATVFEMGSNVARLIMEVNNELEKIDTSLKRNKVSLNINRTAPKHAHNYSTVKRMLTIICLLDEVQRK